MKSSNFEVLPTSKVRAELSSTVTRFRTEGLLSHPILFGSHRKPEAVLISLELFEHLLPEIENIQLNEALERRINDGQKRISFEELVAQVGIDPADIAQ